MFIMDNHIHFFHQYGIGDLSKIIFGDLSSEVNPVSDLGEAKNCLITSNAYNHPKELTDLNFIGVYRRYFDESSSENPEMSSIPLRNLEGYLHPELVQIGYDSDIFPKGINKVIADLIDDNRIRIFPLGEMTSENDKIKGYLNFFIRSMEKKDEVPMDFEYFRRLANTLEMLREISGLTAYENYMREKFSRGVEIYKIMKN